MSIMGQFSPCFPHAGGAAGGYFVNSSNEFKQTNRKTFKELKVAEGCADVQGTRRCFRIKAKNSGVPRFQIVFISASQLCSNKFLIFWIIICEGVQHINKRRVLRICIVHDIRLENVESDFFFKSLFRNFEMFVGNAIRWYTLTNSVFRLLLHILRV